MVHPDSEAAYQRPLWTDPQDQRKAAGSISAGDTEVQTRGNEQGNSETSEGRPLPLREG